MRPDLNLTWSLGLQPRWVEQHFWRSKRRRNCAKKMDLWAARLTIVTGIMVVGLQAQQGARGAIALGPILLVVIEVLRCIWLHTAESSYFRWRPLSQVFERLSRLALTTVTLTAVHREMGNGALYLEHLLCHSTHTATTVLVAARNTLLASGASFHTLQACLSPLPFYRQATLHVAHLLLLTFLFRHSAVALLHTSACSRGLPQVCNGFNWLIRLVENVLYSIPQDHHHFAALCAADAPSLLVPYFQFVLAFLLPAYVAYRSEWNAKAAFLAALIDHQAATRERGAGRGGERKRLVALQMPYVFDLMLLVWFAAVAWIGVMYLQPLWPATQAELVRAVRGYLRWALGGW